MGVKIETISPGDGVNFPKKGDQVSIHYTGWLHDKTKPKGQQEGQQFDSSYKRNKPFTTQIGVGSVIQGWDQGVPQLSLGQKAKLFITSDFAYGKNGAGDIIPGNADLIFEVELLQINGLKK